MSVALLLARDGHAVTLVERDRFGVGEPEGAPAWRRRGIPHFLQPHAFIPRGRTELREHWRDVYDALLGAGARDVDLRPKLPGPLRSEDEDLQYLAVRRPVIEWGLRRAVADEARIRVLDGAHATGLALVGGRVCGVQVDGGELAADVVVDALGRRTSSPAWLAGAGRGAELVETSDCSVIYYSRYYQQRPGFELPEGPWLLSPRADLGYLAYATFPGDSRTFAVLLAVPPGVAAWRVLRDARAFEAAVAQIPMLRGWVDPVGVDPITDVMPMAGLRNSIRHYEPESAIGLVPIGDALCHTDPVLAHGLAFAFIHAAAFASALRDHDDLGDAGAAYAGEVMPAVRERFTFASELDAQRHRMWLGEPVDLAHAGGDYALFTMAAAGAVAMVDPDVFRTFVRRIGLLDSTEVLDGDDAMQRHIEAAFQELVSGPRAPQGPPQEAMTAIVGDALRR
jgi:2-polyprenyl-6-methoxyphenol hydroxylase-like FAD-dependent oxidoreductase